MKLLSFLWSSLTCQSGNRNWYSSCASCVPSHCPGASTYWAGHNRARYKAQGTPANERSDWVNSGGTGLGIRSSKCQITLAMSPQEHCRNVRNVLETDWKQRTHMTSSLNLREVVIKAYTVMKRNGKEFKPWKTEELLMSGGSLIKYLNQSGTFQVDTILRRPGPWGCNHALHKRSFGSTVWQSTWLANQYQRNNFLSNQLDYKELPFTG